MARLWPLLSTGYTVIVSRIRCPVSSNEHGLEALATAGPKLPAGQAASSSDICAGREILDWPRSLRADILYRP
jgi:hypothetical protein